MSSTWTGTPASRVLEAGADQLGGEQRPELIVDLVEQGRIGEERIDVSVRRILRDKFRLGLFDDRRYSPRASPFIWTASTRTWRPATRR
ncbi:hypothetical protein [Actinoplanes sp. NPDC023714]|uniref:hypothetical protein n=1 Tax=Actinoplanes sp. NPDC023714 TaxID=3154322 RepID=UPI0033E7527C